MLQDWRRDFLRGGLRSRKAKISEGYWLSGTFSDGTYLYHCIFPRALGQTSHLSGVKGNVKVPRQRGEGGVSILNGMALHPCYLQFSCFSSPAISWKLRTLIKLPRVRQTHLKTALFEPLDSLLGSVLLRSNQRFQQRQILTRQKAMKTQLNTNLDRVAFRRSPWKYSLGTWTTISSFPVSGSPDIVLNRSSKCGGTSLNAVSVWRDFGDAASLGPMPWLSTRQRIK